MNLWVGTAVSAARCRVTRLLDLLRDSGRWRCAENTQLTRLELRRGQSPRASGIGADARTRHTTNSNNASACNTSKVTIAAR